jgi:hypothetical protein
VPEPGPARQPFRAREVALGLEQRLVAAADVVRAAFRRGQGQRGQPPGLMTRRAQIDGEPGQAGQGLGVSGDQEVAP